MALKPGLTGHAELVVTEADTALAWRSGDVPVLATPRLLALCEEATCAAIAGQLGANETSVGMRVQFDHMQPTSVGRPVSADATLEKIEGRRLTFVVNAHDAGGLIAAGRITRVVLDRDRFMEKTG